MPPPRGSTWMNDSLRGGDDTCRLLRGDDCLDNIDAEGAPRHDDTVEQCSLITLDGRKLRCQLPNNSNFDIDETVLHSLLRSHCQELATYFIKQLLVPVIIWF